MLPLVSLVSVIVCLTFFLFLFLLSRYLSYFQHHHQQPFYVLLLVIGNRNSILSHPHPVATGDLFQVLSPAGGACVLHCARRFVNSTREPSLPIGYGFFSRYDQLLTHRELSRLCRAQVSCHPSLRREIKKRWR